MLVNYIPKGFFSFQMDVLSLHIEPISVLFSYHHKVYFELDITPKLLFICLYFSFLPWPLGKLPCCSSIFHTFRSQVMLWCAAWHSPCSHWEKRSRQGAKSWQRADLALFPSPTHLVCCCPNLFTMNTTAWEKINKIPNPQQGSHQSSLMTPCTSSPGMK